MNPAAALLSGLVLVYRGVVSPVLPGCCRFQPTCSAYALEAVRRFGALRGSWLAVRRVGRCHPWGGSGYDPLPDATAPGPERSGGRNSSGPVSPGLKCQGPKVHGPGFSGVGPHPSVHARDGRRAATLPPVSSFRHS